MHSHHEKSTLDSVQPVYLTALDLPVPPRSSLPADLQKYFSICDEKIGFLPNVLSAYTFDEKKLRAFIGFYNDLMLDDSPLDKLEREMIAVVVSSANRCYYCQVAHGQAVRELSGDPVLGELLVMNYRVANLSPAQGAMLDFAHKMTVEPDAIVEADRAVLRDAGYDDRRHLGHRRGRRVFQHDQSHGNRSRHDAEHRVSRGEPLAVHADDQPTVMHATLPARGSPMSRIASFICGSLLCVRKLVAGGEDDRPHQLQPRRRRRRRMPPSANAHPDAGGLQKVARRDPGRPVPAQSHVRDVPRTASVRRAAGGLIRAPPWTTNWPPIARFKAALAGHRSGRTDTRSIGWTGSTCCTTSSRAGSTPPKCACGPATPTSTAAASRARRMS